MKKILFLAAFAAAVLCSCNKTEESLISATEAPVQTVHFTAGSVETKTVFDTPTGNSYPVLWSGNEEVAISLNLESIDDVKKVKVAASDDKKTATFSAAFTPASENTFVVVSPAVALRSVNKSTQKILVEIPSGQVCTDASPDEKAQVMAGISPTTKDVFPVPVNVSLGHIPAYLHLSFANTDLGGGVVQAVSISSSENICGRFYFTSTKSYEPGTSMLKTVCVSPNSLDHVWAAVAPADLSKTTLTVTVHTDKGSLTKDITLGEGREMKSGEIYRMSIDMSGIVMADPVVYTKVTNTNQLNYGDKIILASADGVAMSTAQNSNNRSGTGVCRSTDGNTILDPSSSVEIITLEDGHKPGLWAFKATSTANPGYLYAANVSKTNSLRTQPSLDESGSWDLHIDDGESNIHKTVDIAADVTWRNLLRFNSESNLFAAYGPSTTQQKVCIYRKDGMALPHFVAQMPTGSQSVSYESTTLPIYVYSNVDWTIAVSGEGATLDKSGGNGNDTVHLELTKNTSTTNARSVTVTVTTESNVETKTFIFNIKQSADISSAVKVYALIPTGDDGTQSTFAGSSDATMGGIVWNITGNGKTNNPFWRIGGKNLDCVDRGIYSKTAITHDVVKVIVHHGTVDDGCTINSFTFTVHSSAADAATGDNPISTLTGPVSANSDTEFIKTDLTSWKGRYYRMIYNFTVLDKKNNQRLEFKGADFWGYLAE